jgi:hypothetical protein
MMARDIRTLWCDDLSQFYERFREHSQITKVDSSSLYVAISLTDVLKVLKLDYSSLEFNLQVNY